MEFDLSEIYSSLGSIGSDVWDRVAVVHVSREFFWQASKYWVQREAVDGRPLDFLSGKPAVVSKDQWEPFLLIEADGTVIPL